MCELRSLGHCPGGFLHMSFAVELSRELISGTSAELGWQMWMLSTSQT